MFKIGDIVRHNSEGRKIYKNEMYDQPFEVIWVSIDGHTTKVSGFRPKFDICYSSGLLILDIDYMRDKKIKKILSGK